MADKYDKPEDFYKVYSEHREYVEPIIRKKHRRDFTKNFWDPCDFQVGSSILEIGCGTGLFLAYLEDAGIEDFLGIDSDPKVLEYMHDKIRNNVQIIEIFEFLDSIEGKKKFDKIVLIDVLEHFTPGEGVDLLQKLKPLLNKNGGIVVRVPNLASPWGHQWQYHDLTHKAGYTSGSLRQLGLAAGYECSVHGYRRGNPRKQFIEKLFHSIIGRLVTEPPDIWSAANIGHFKPMDTP